MSTMMSDDFILEVPDVDSFKMWQGLVGPYFTPYIDEYGILSWTNTGGLVNPAAVSVIGPPGKGLEVKGVVATYADLPQNPQDGDTYLVGTEAPYDGYMWIDGEWIEIGDVSKGEDGRGIVSITKTGASGLVDEYTILYTEGPPTVYYVTNGKDGVDGQDGQDGVGVPTGGTTGQVLAKASGTDYDTEWVDQSGGGSDGIRENLLDNWYFVGGGSQLGSGVFPINQRGQTSYTGSAAYTLDRWFLQYDTNLQVLSTGTKISGRWDMQQKLGSLPSGIYTASVLLSDYQSAPNIKIELFDSNGTSFAQSTTNNNGLITITMSSANAPAKISLNLADSSGNSEATITAIKLELGDTQTLAHQENGTWVLNEIPDYDEQLYRCCASAADSGDVYANNPYTNVGSVYIGTSEPTNKNIKFWLDTDEPGMSAVSSVNGATGTVVLDADDVGAMSEWDLLWTNASPSSSFAAQTVLLDLSGYDAVFVDVISYGGETPHVNSICPKGISTKINRTNPVSANAKMYSGQRDATVSDTGVDFSDGMQSSVSSNGATNNLVLIPYRIYGIKGVTA